MRARISGPVRRSTWLGPLPPGETVQKCSSQTDLRLALADLFDGADVPERPSATFMRLVCIQKARAWRLSTALDGWLPTG